MDEISFQTRYILKAISVGTTNANRYVTQVTSDGTYDSILVLGETADPTPATRENYARFVFVNPTDPLSTAPVEGTTQAVTIINANEKAPTAVVNGVSPFIFEAISDFAQSASWDTGAGNLGLLKTNTTLAVMTEDAYECSYNPPDQRLLAVVPGGDDAIRITFQFWPEDGGDHNPGPPTEGAALLYRHIYSIFANVASYSNAESLIGYWKGTSGTDSTFYGPQYADVENHPTPMRRFVLLNEADETDVGQVTPDQPFSLFCVDNDQYVGQDLADVDFENRELFKFSESDLGELGDITAQVDDTDNYVIMSAGGAITFSTYRDEGTMRIFTGTLPVGNGLRILFMNPDGSSRQGEPFDGVPTPAPTNSPVPPPPSPVNPTNPSSNQLISPAAETVFTVSIVFAVLYLLLMLTL